MFVVSGFMLCYGCAFAFVPQWVPSLWPFSLLLELLVSTLCYRGYDRMCVFGLLGPRTRQGHNNNSGVCLVVRSHSMCAWVSRLTPHEPSLDLLLWMALFSLLPSHSSCSLHVICLSFHLLSCLLIFYTIPFSLISSRSSLSLTSQHTLQNALLESKRRRKRGRGLQRLVCAALHVVPFI